MKFFKRVSALLAAAVLCLSLTGCGGFSDTVKILVQGNLDEIYLGQANADYLKLIKSDEKEAQENYIGGLETEAEFFISYFGIEYPTEELMGEIVEMYKQIYAHSMYIVNDPAKLDDDTYAVKIQISPIDIFKLVSDNFDDGMDEFYSKYEQVDIDAMSEEEYARFDLDWAHAIIKLVYEQLPNVGYLEEQSIAIQVAKNKDGIWTITDNDLGSIDNAIIYYP